MTTGRVILVFQEGADIDSYIGGFLAGAMMLGGVVPEKFDNVAVTDVDIANMRRDPTCNLQQKDGKWYHVRQCTEKPGETHYDAIGVFDAVFVPVGGMPLPRKGSEVIN